MILPTQDEAALLTDSDILEVVPFNVNQNQMLLYWLKKIAMTQLKKIENLGYYKGLPTSIEEALNSGDGAYRP